MIISYNDEFLYDIAFERKKLFSILDICDLVLKMDRTGPRTDIEQIRRTFIFRGSEYNIALYTDDNDNYHVDIKVNGIIRGISAIRKLYWEVDDAINQLDMI